MSSNINYGIPNAIWDCCVNSEGKIVIDGELGRETYSLDVNPSALSVACQTANARRDYMFRGMTQEEISYCERCTRIK